MELYDLQGAVDVSGEKEIEAALKKRYGNGFNSFWFSPGGEKFPVMAILVAGELASVHYFPEDRHPGFRSVGNVETLDPDEMTAFYMNNLGAPYGLGGDSESPLLVGKKFLMISRIRRLISERSR